MNKITLKNISKFYKTNEKAVCGLYNINLELNFGQLILLKGPSGSGKSTLINIIAGLEKADNGEVILDKKVMRKNDLRSLSSVGFQNHILINNLTVEDNLNLYINIIGENEKTKNKVDKLLKKLNLYKYKKKRVSKLSLGEKARLSFIRSLLKPCPILMLDEPTASQDDKNSKIIYNILKNESKTKLVIVISHKQDELENMSDKVITLFNHEIISEQNKKESKPRNYKYKQNNYNIKNKFKTAFILLKCSKSIILLIIIFLFLTFKLSLNIINLNIKYTPFKYNYILRDLTNNSVIVNKENKGPITKSDIKFLKNIGLKDIRNSLFTNEKVTLKYKHNTLKISFIESKNDGVILYLDNNKYLKYKSFKGKYVSIKYGNYKDIIYINEIKKGNNYVLLPTNITNTIKVKILEDKSILIQNNKIISNVLPEFNDDLEFTSSIRYMLPYSDISVGIKRENNIIYTSNSEYEKLKSLGIYELSANINDKNKRIIKTKLENKGYNIYFGSDLLYYDKTTLEVLLFLRFILIIISLTILYLFVYFVLYFLISSFNYFEVLLKLGLSISNTTLICLINLYFSLFISLVIFIISGNLKYESMKHVLFVFILICFIIFFSCINSVRRKYDRN